MNEPFRMNRGGRSRWRRTHRWPYRTRAFSKPTYMQPIVPTALELKCRDIALTDPESFDDALYTGASNNYINLCKDLSIQLIIKEKVINREKYKIIVPTYGPSYEPYSSQSLIGVL